MRFDDIRSAIRKPECFINPRRACAARVTILGLCVSVCVHAYSETKYLKSSANDVSRTNARKIMRRFC